MGKIYSAPEHIKVPNWDIEKTREENLDAEKKYLNELAEFIRNRHKNPTDKIGRTIQFPVADGYAIYMVASLRPVELVHISIGDAWNYEYAHRLTMSDILEKIEQQDAINKLFKNKV